MKTVRTMIAFRTPTIRNLLFREAAPCLRTSQRRWAQVHDIRPARTDRKPHDVLEKYSEKLARKAKEEGLSDVEELKSAYKEKIHKRRNEAISVALPSLTSLSSLHPRHLPSIQPEALAEQSFSDSKLPINKPSNPHGVKTLSSYIDVEKTRELPEKDIEQIWRLRHARNPQSLCAVIPQPTYSRIVATAKSHPQFILPIPREGKGAEMHFLEWTFPTPTTVTVIFTQLAEYRLRGEYSQPHTVVSHHTDLASSKGLVLLQGSVTEGRGVSVEEGKWLLMCLQNFYTAGHGNDRRKKLLEQFTRGDFAFEINELLEEAERIT